MISILFQPLFFYALLAILFVISAVALFSLGDREKKTVKEKQQDSEKDKMRIAELESELERNKAEHSLKISQVEATAKENDESLRQRSLELESKLKGYEQLKAQTQEAESGLRSKDELLKKQLADRQELDNKVTTLQQELEKSKRELSVANQMYEGCKGQYEELEEKFAQLFQQFLAEQKKNQAANNIQKPAPIDKAPQQAEDEIIQERPAEEKIQPHVDLSQIPKIEIRNLPNFEVPPETEGQEKEIPPSDND
jgi:DNA repair exonuclease SbcCD ATPase subunit